MEPTTEVLQATNLQKFFPVYRLLRQIGEVKAVNGISFALQKGETLSIVGESGCGKTTLARLLTQLDNLTAGTMTLNGQPVSSISNRQFRQTIQMIFQDPYSSINPRKKAWQIIAEPLFINTDLAKQECREIALNTMEKVGLRKEYAERYPHMFSGGQRQRIGLARALVLEPQVIICDEPVSALDVSIQAQILNLLKEIKQERNISYLFITHDLSVVKHISDRVMVLYLGKIVEITSREQLFQTPRHPYTQALLASTPTITGRSGVNQPKLKGELPSALSLPKGCSFQARCPFVQQICRQESPPLRAITEDHQVACHFADLPAQSAH